MTAVACTCAAALETANRTATLEAATNFITPRILLSSCDRPCFSRIQIPCLTQWMQTSDQSLSGWAWPSAPRPIPRSYNHSVHSSAELTFRTELRREVLGSGLTVLVQEVHTTPLVSVWCWYRVGSGDEVPGQTGVSHWVDQINLKGRRNPPRDERRGIVHPFGGPGNGYRGIDQPTFLKTAGKDALDTLLF